MKNGMPPCQDTPDLFDSCHSPFLCLCIWEEVGQNLIFESYFDVAILEIVAIGKATYGDTFVCDKTPQNKILYQIKPIYYILF